MLARILVVIVAVAAAAALLAGWRFAIFLLPFGWTGEAERLAALLHIAPDKTVADIGAGDGALAVEMARRVGPGGVVFATELSAERRENIASRLLRDGVGNVRVVEAGERDTHLADDCCDAIWLRTVLHHVGEVTPFATGLARALKADGRVAIIDFAPGALWFHGHDHGVAADTVRRAFEHAGFTLVHHEPSWGGGTYALVFERARTWKK